MITILLATCYQGKYAECPSLYNAVVAVETWALILSKVGVGQALVDHFPICDPSPFSDLGIYSSGVYEFSPSLSCLLEKFVSVSALLDERPPIMVGELENSPQHQHHN